jgi:two-component sensor histidine kinase
LRAEEERYHDLLLELQHRVKNSMQTIAALIGLEESRCSGEETGAVLGTLRERVETMSALYAMLHQSGDTREIESAEYLGTIIRALSDSNAVGDRSIRIEKRIDSIRMNAKQASALGLIVNELLTNSFKYAFTGRESGAVRIELEERGNTVVLAVADDGNGFPADFDPETSDGFGLLMIRGLCVQLNGSFRFDQVEAEGHGTSCRLTFPLEQAGAGVGRPSEQKKQ